MHVITTSQLQHILIQISPSLGSSGVYHMIDMCETDLGKQPCIYRQLILLQTNHTINMNRELLACATLPGSHQCFPIHRRWCCQVHPQTSPAAEDLDLPRSLPTAGLWVHRSQQDLQCMSTGFRTSAAAFLFQVGCQTTGNLPVSVQSGSTCNEDAVDDSNDISACCQLRPTKFNACLKDASSRPSAGIMLPHYLYAILSDFLLQCK